MHRSSLTAALLAATLVADANGAHSLALYLVLAAIPALAWTSLAYFGELVDGRAADDTGALNVGLASLALALVVTVGSFFAVQPLVDLARHAALTLAF